MENKKKKKDENWDNGEESSFENSKCQQTRNF